MPGDGTAYEMFPPTTNSGTWSQSVLRSFGKGKDGSHPRAGLIIDVQGNLYGTTRDGGLPVGKNGGGTVFKLTPPSKPSGKYKESILCKFWKTVKNKHADGTGPEAGLNHGCDGNF